MTYPNQVFKQKTCMYCNAVFEPRSGRSKYCRTCAPIVHAKQRYTWFENNRERNSDKCLDYYYTHLEALHAYGKNWRKENQDKRRVNQHNRRARIKGNGGTLPPDAEDVLFKQQSGLCYLCNNPFPMLNDPASIDHKIPISRGGSNDISNVALAHLSCNLQKGTKTDIEFAGVGGQ